MRSRNDNSDRDNFLLIDHDLILKQGKEAVFGIGKAQRVYYFNQRKEPELGKGLLFQAEKGTIPMIREMVTIPSRERNQS